MEKCVPCCDYCKYYLDDYSNGKFSGYGRCLFHSKAAYAFEDCKEFKCVVHDDKGCYVDKKIFDEVYDHCLLDIDMKWECDYAVRNDINDKSECKYWK